MRYGIVKTLSLILLFSLVGYVNSSAVSLTREVQEKLRKEGRLGEWVKRWESAAQGGMYEKTPAQLLRLAKIESEGFAQPETLKPLVLCVDFSDNVHTRDTSEFTTLLFSKDFTVTTGSFRDYYLENSYGQHDPNGGVYGWVRAPQTYEYYTWGLNGIYGSYPHNARRLVYDALIAADPFVNYQDYDNNNNGWIDGLIVVHAGPGAEETGDDWDIWSHRWSLLSQLTLDGVKMEDYTMQPETHENGSLIDIGVFCHEWGHFLGINWEEYDTDYDYSYGLGDWSVMATGCYNYGGKKPAHHSAFCKYKLGWLTFNQLSSNQTNAEIPQVETSPVAYRLWTSGLGVWEYFVVENRQMAGFDSHLPGSGLLIYHVDETKSGNDLEWCPESDPTQHYKTALEQADGKFQLEGCYGFGLNQGDGYDPFPGYGNKRSFEDTTTPSSRDYNDNSTQVAVWNISDSDSAMYANLDVVWSRPNLRVDELFFNDSTEGDGDGYPEPEETVNLYLVISNSWGNLSNASVVASVDTAGITFGIDSVNIGDVVSGGTTDNYGNPLEFTVASGFPNKKVNFTFHVCGNGGAYCTDLVKGANVGPAEILLVDDDDHTSGSSNYMAYYQKPLDLLGVVYDVWDKQAKPDLSIDLSAYPIVIWFTGDHRLTLLSSQDVADLMSYLDSGGKLFLTSQDAAEKLSSSGTTLDSTFLADYLHASYVGGFGHEIYLAKGVTGDPLADSLYMFFGDVMAPANQDSKDIVIPEAGASEIIRYAKSYNTIMDSVAGIKYQGDFKVVFFGFGFEGMDSSGGVVSGGHLSKPVFVMERVLNWLRGSSDVSDEEDDMVNLPQAIQLYQNHPNPFNPSTNIRFRIHGPPFMVQKPIHTTLKIYNIRGQLVRTLVDEEKTPGEYSVTWDGKNQQGREVSSGIYFYQLRAKDQTEVKKMVLLK